MANTLEDFARRLFGGADPGTQDWLRTFQDHLTRLSGPGYGAMDDHWRNPDFDPQPPIWTEPPPGYVTQSVPATSPTLTGPITTGYYRPPADVVGAPGTDPPPPQVGPVTTGYYRPPAADATPPVGVGNSMWPGWKPAWQASMATPSQGSNPTTAAALISYLMGGHDPRNLGTRGMSGAGNKFSFGGVTYDPTQDLGRQYQNMSATSGKLLNKGASVWNFIYRLQQLMNQRDNGGNPDRGVRADSTDPELAKLAAQFVNSKNTGSTGLRLS